VALPGTYVLASIDLRFTRASKPPLHGNVAVIEAETSHLCSLTCILEETSLNEAVSNVTNVILPFTARPFWNEFGKTADLREPT
jgi:hypothetical protein